jgi:hypothetical protein
LNSRRLILEGRMEIQKEVINKAHNYEQTTRHIKEMIELSLPGQ